MEPTLDLLTVLDFKHKLEPLLEMLVEKEKTMAPEDWTDLVNLTRQRIITRPEQYLAGEIPPKEIIRATVDLVFDELQGKSFILTEN